MGIWGAAQGIAFGLGGFSGTALVDVARLVLPSPEWAYGLVFALEAMLFLIAATIGLRIETPQAGQERMIGDGLAASMQS